MWHHDNKVAVNFTGEDRYPTTPPFHPPERYPELGDGEVDPENRIYSAVRATLHQFGLDRENFGTPHWNPLGDVVRPGTTVFIKPNTVQHFNYSGKDIFSVITHASVIRPILDYLLKALDGRGRVIVGDSQEMFGHFDEAMQISGLASVVEFCRDRSSIEIECFDLRTERGVKTWFGGDWGRRKVEHDPRGYRLVDVGESSYFRDIDPKKLRMSLCPRRKMLKHHSGGRHEYLYPSSVLQSDTIISVPKLKNHARTAVTLTIKGFLGLVAGKYSLPHYTIGTPEQGGDEYPRRSARKRICSMLVDAGQSCQFPPLQALFTVARQAVLKTRRIAPFVDNIVEARWYGNDTVWRTLLDLYRATFFADRDGRLCETPQRNHFCLMDGIIGGEGNGPLAPDPIAAGVLLAGLNPVAIDAVATSLMGYKVDVIPTISNALKALDGEQSFFEGIEVIDDGTAVGVGEFLERRNLNFEAHPEWKGRVERAPDSCRQAAARCEQPSAT